MAPFSTVSASSARSSVISGSSSRTSMMRLAQAMDRVRIIITMDTIIRLTRISLA